MNDIEAMECGELLFQVSMIALGTDVEWLAVLHGEFYGGTVNNEIEADVFNDFRANL